MYARRVLVALILTAIAGTYMAVQAQEVLTGMFRLTHTTTEVVGPQMAEALSEIIPIDEELQWQVYVPQTYRPDRPPGVFVFIDPKGWGGIPDKWRPVFDRYNLIWIGWKMNERNPPQLKRVLTTRLSKDALEADYAVDLNRLYVGSAGGSALTAVNVLISANEFVGAVYMSGSLYWGDTKPPQLDLLRRKYHVFITGSNDEAKQTVRRDYESYKKDGIENAKLIFETGRLRDMPEPEHIDEAIRYLDSRLTR